MTLYQAQRLIAYLEKRRIDVLNNAKKNIKEINGILYENTLEDADLELLQNIEAEILQAFDELQANPEIFQNIKMWNLEVEGSYSQEGLAEKLISRIDNIEGVLSENDPLAEKVIKILNAHSLSPLEFSEDLGLWQIRVLLNTQEANLICGVFCDEFSSELGAKKIKLSRKYTRPYLMGLLTDKDVEAFLQANPGLNYDF